VANEMVDPVSRASTSAISLRRRLTISAAFRNSPAFSVVPLVRGKLHPYPLRHKHHLIEKRFISDGVASTG
jgi:hypothetical protein